MTYLNNKKTKTIINEITSKDILTKEVSELLSDQGVAIIYNDKKLIKKLINLKSEINALLEPSNLDYKSYLVNRIEYFEQKIRNSIAYHEENKSLAHDDCFDYSAEIAGELVQYYIA